MNRSLRKLNSRRGETIAETLASTLIAALMIVILTGAIVTAARINQKARNQDNDVSLQAKSQSNGTVTVTCVDAGTERSIDYPVTYYVTQDPEFVYYEVDADADPGQIDMPID